MSSHIGDKILEGIKRVFYNKTPPSETTPENLRNGFDYLINQLRINKKLGKADFEHLRQYAKNFKGSAREIDTLFENTPGTSKRPRDAILLVTQMHPSLPFSLKKDWIENARPDIFAPHQMLITMGPESCSFSARQFPIAFGTDHTLERFLQRAKTKLEYSSDDFQFTLASGLALLYTMQTIYDQDKAQISPVALWHSNGLFLGHQEICSAFNFDWHTAIGIVENGIFREEHSNQARLDTWAPTRRIYINTFVGLDDLFPEQYELYEKIHDIFSQTHAQIATKNIFNFFAIPAGKSFESDPDVKKLVLDIKELLHSPLWINAIRGGIKHLPEEPIEGGSIDAAIVCHETIKELKELFSNPTTLANILEEIENETDDRERQAIGQQVDEVRKALDEIEDILGKRDSSPRPGN